MPKIMPQEIEVWYLIPALRRELAKAFIKDFKLTQKESAKLLGLTEAAVSQYLKSKRASELKFSKKDLLEIKKTARSIIENKKNMVGSLYNLSIKLRSRGTICKIHKKLDKQIEKNCRICVKPN